jgi:Asp/Glu/hydantoin racemase
VLSVMCEMGKKLVEDVRVIDGVLAGVQHLAGLRRLGARTAENGMYTCSAADRKGRGQGWH